MTQPTQKCGPLQSLFTAAQAAAAGAKGERRAAAFLCRERSFRIVARNWRSPRDQREEIDLIAWDGKILVFVEVKARAESALVPGYFAVDRRKKRVLRRAVRAYLQSVRPRPHTFRLDVVEISLTGGAPILRHFENVGLFAKHFRGG